MTTREFTPGLAVRPRIVEIAEQVEQATAFFGYRCERVAEQSWPWLQVWDDDSLFAVRIGRDDEMGIKTDGAVFYHRPLQALPSQLLDAIRSRNVWCRAQTIRHQDRMATTVRSRPSSTPLPDTLYRFTLTGDDAFWFVRALAQNAPTDVRFTPVTQMGRFRVHYHNGELRILGGHIMDTYPLHALEQSLTLLGITRFIVA